MNDSVSENGRVNNSPDNTQNTEDLKAAREKMRLLYGSKPSIKVLGYDSNDEPIPEEQAQLIDPPKSSVANSSRQQSQLPENEDVDYNAPWDVRIPSENNVSNSGSDNKKNELQPKSSTYNQPVQQQSQLLENEDADYNAPWDVRIPSENNVSNSGSDNKKNELQPKSSTYNQPVQQQSQLLENEDADCNIPWTVRIPSENNASDSGSDNKKNELQPKSSTYNQPVQQQSPLPSTNDAFLVNENQYNSYPPINPVNSSSGSFPDHSMQITADPYYMTPTDRSAVNRKLASAIIKMASHNEDLRYKYEKKRLNQRSDPTETTKYTNSSTDATTSQTSTFIDWKKLVEEFIKKYAIVAVKKRGKRDRVIMILNEDENRHVEVSLKDLEDYCISFIEDAYPDIEIATKNVNRIMSRLKHRISKLEKTSLRQLEAHQVMFMNGFFDVRESKFHSISESDRNQYYTTFSFEVDYSERFRAPRVFCKLLFDALNGDKEAIALAYQQIGAIFTPIPTLKKIFLFQGASNAGKTRIGNIIAKCMPEDDTLVLNNLSELTKDKLDSSPLRLILIKELSKNKLYAKQISKLKALSDGSSDTAFTKILMSTNYLIYTDEDGSIEPALRNRLSTLPFPKPMTNSDPDVSCFEDVHFEKEKQGIIIRALQAFSKVFNNNNKFYKDFEPNICVDAENEQEELVDDNQSTRNDFIGHVSVYEIVKQLFDICSEVNGEMTAKRIMDAVNNFQPMNQARISRSEEVGKVLRKTFGKELKSCKIKGVICYNLNWKSKE